MNVSSMRAGLSARIALSGPIHFVRIGWRTVSTKGTHGDHGGFTPAWEVASYILQQGKGGHVVASKNPKGKLGSIHYSMFTAIRAAKLYASRGTIRSQAYGRLKDHQVRNIVRQLEAGAQ